MSNHITLHQDTQSDWAFVTEGDRTVDEGHVQDVSARLIERLIQVRDVRIVDRGFAQRRVRPTFTIPASEIFELEDR